MVSTGTGGGEPAGMPPGEAGFCVQCGTAFAAGQHYCGRCGQPLATVGADDRMTAGVPPGGLADAPAGSVPPGTASQATGARADGPPFDAAVVIGAVILTVLFPFIALIVALVLRSGEVIQSRRQFLKNWAIGSAAWLCTGWLIVLIVFASAGRASRELQGRHRPAHPAQLRKLRWPQLDGHLRVHERGHDNQVRPGRPGPRRRVASLAGGPVGVGGQPDLARAAPIRRSWTVAPPSANSLRLAAVK